MRRTRHITLAVSVALVTAGCTGAGDPAPSTDSDTPTTAQAVPNEPDESDGPSEPANPESAEPTTPAPQGPTDGSCRPESTYADEFDGTTPNPEPDAFRRYDYSGQIQEQSGPSIVLSDLRVGVHEGYDRFVAEFTLASWIDDPPAEPAQPGINVHYVTCASPSDAALDIPIDGEDILGIGLLGAARNFDDNGYVEPPPVEFDGTTITDARYIGEHGGSASLFIGVGHERADFRVFSLTDPYRVVVDIAHPD